MPVYKSLPDRRLAELLSTGDGSAFTEIYERYWQKLLAIAYNHLKDKSAAEEILQEVFMSLWDRRYTLQLDPVGGYLATAVKFSVFKHFSRKKRQQELLESNYKIVSIAPHDEQIYAQFLSEYINGIVETLPEKCKLVYKYSRQENLTIPEIAAKMDIAEKTAEAHLTKALNTIRTALKTSAILFVAGHFLK